VTRIAHFTGDSVTDAERRTSEDGLGDGYVRVLSRRPGLQGWSVENSGVSGNRTSDLQARWDVDVLDHAPDVLSILVGVNDMWRRYDNDDPTDAAVFEERYRALLTAAVAASVSESTAGSTAGSGSHALHLVLVEPFLLPVRPEQETWLEDLDPKREVVKRLADEFSAAFVPLHVELTRLAASVGPATLADDGVHPTPAGHEALADIWLAHASLPV
jgi:acyl-CoA thioesterase-1